VQRVKVKIVIFFNTSAMEKMKMINFSLEKIRQDLENFSVEMQREWYLNWSGQKDDLRLSDIYEKYSHLFTKEKIMAIKSLRKEAVGEEKRRLMYLQSFLVSGYLGMIVKELTDKAETIQSLEKIKVNGEEIPYRFVAIKIANESQRSKRAKIYKARNKVINDKINPILEKRMEKLHASAKDLDYENYLALYRDIKGIDFKSLEGLLQKFNSETESIYVDRMTQILKEKVKVKLEEAEKHDIAFLFRAKEFDKYFKKEKIVETFQKTLAGMGIPLEKQKNIEIDKEERLKKSPRAFCSPIKVPDEIKLVIMPVGGHDDYAALFHEGGHTEHYAFVNRNLAVEYKRLGDNSVTESFAFLFEYLTQNEEWLRQYISPKITEKYLEFATLYTLFFVRSYGAKLSYENKLHMSPTLKRMKETYKKIMEKVLKFKHPQSHYLITVDDALYCAQYLQAWIFEAQLRNKLEEKFGKEWFNNPETGKFLKELWFHGQKFNVVELAQQLGFSGLDIKPLLLNIKERLS
jgi:hypothetical protein